MNVTIPCRSRYPELAALAGERPLADVELTVTLARATYHGHTELTVRPGVVDASAVELYGYSQCHLLAAAMHERTGWPLALVELAEPQHRWVHVGVFTPAGDVLDIHGVRPVAQVVAETDREHDLRVHVRRVRTLGDLGALLMPDAPRTAWTYGMNEVAVELTGLFADLLLAQADAFEAVQGR